jgi:pyridoxamine 5'-phosphate oxidase
MESIASIRKDYKQQSLLEKDVLPNPYNQFEKWWQEAINSNIDEVNAMTLATVTAHGKPTARIVLLKGFDEKGFVFFTNYESNKAKAMAQNDAVCLVFFWKELERQVRIEGNIHKLSDSENDAYFLSRPIGSRIGAWASPQSSIIDGRELLEKNVTAYTNKFNSGDVPRPQHWGGYCVSPTLLEFWQGRSSRLHDRFEYQLKENNHWDINRLAP